MRIKYLLLLTFIITIFVLSCETIYDESDPKPVIEFKCEADSINTLLIHFINNTVNASSYSWMFGDGETSIEASPSHKYQSNGTYNVTLNATGNGGSNTLSKSITVPLPGK